MKKTKKLLKNVLTILICCGMIFNTANVSTLAAETQTSNIHISFLDRIVNIFVRLIILIRGSKRLFSNVTSAQEYLASLKGEQGDYQLSARLKSTVSERRIDEMQCFLLTKEGSSSQKQVIYLPGGAFVREPTSLHWSMLDKLCQNTGASITCVIYPKAPTHTYVDTYPQLIRLYSELLKTTEAQDITIMGDSSGATIAVTLTRWLKAEGLPQPGKLILYSPLLDLTLENTDINKTIATDPMLGLDGLKLFVDAWTGGEDKQSALLNPMCCDLSVLPDTEIYCGTGDVMIYDARLFYDKASKQSKNSVKLYEYEDMYHCFMLYPLNAANDVLDKTQDTF